MDEENKHPSRKRTRSAKGLEFDEMQNRKSNKSVSKSDGKGEKRSRLDNDKPKASRRIIFQEDGKQNAQVKLSKNNNVTSVVDRSRDNLKFGKTSKTAKCSFKQGFGLRSSVFGKVILSNFFME